MDDQAYGKSLAEARDASRSVAVKIKENLKVNNDFIMS